jgi:hypothetical protein
MIIAPEEMKESLVHVPLRQRKTLPLSQLLLSSLNLSQLPSLSQLLLPSLNPSLLWLPLLLLLLAAISLPSGSRSNT